MVSSVKRMWICTIYTNLKHTGGCLIHPSAIKNSHKGYRECVWWGEAVRSFASILENKSEVQNKCLSVPLRPSSISAQLHRACLHFDLLLCLRTLGLLMADAGPHGHHRPSSVNGMEEVPGLFWYLTWIGTC